MRKSKFSEQQIITILKAVEAGQTVRDVCRHRQLGLVAFEHGLYLRAHPEEIRNISIWIRLNICTDEGQGLYKK